MTIDTKAMRSLMDDAPSGMVGVTLPIIYEPWLPEPERWVVAAGGFGNDPAVVWMRAMVSGAANALIPLCDALDQRDARIVELETLVNQRIDMAYATGLAVQKLQADAADFATLVPLVMAWADKLTNLRVAAKSGHVFPSDYAACDHRDTSDALIAAIDTIRARRAGGKK